MRTVQGQPHPVHIACADASQRALERPPSLAPHPSGWIRRKPNLRLGAAASPAPEANANTSSQTIDALTQPPTLPRRAIPFLTYEASY